MKRFIFLFLFSFSLCQASFQGTLGGHFNYMRMEFDNPEKLKGFLGGVTAKVEYCWWQLSVFGRYEGYWNAGDICGNPCQKSDVSEHLAYGAFSYYGWQCGCLTFAPYVGFGYNIFNNTQDPCTAHLTYHFKKWVVPVGATLWWQGSSCYAWGLQGEWRPDVRSNIQVMGYCFCSKNEHAFRVQLPFIFCQNCYSFQFVPFYDWNKFGKSEEKNENGVPFGIPSLTRWDLGARFLLSYCF